MRELHGSLHTLLLYDTTSNILVIYQYYQLRLLNLILKQMYKVSPKRMFTLKITQNRKAQYMTCIQTNYPEM